MAILPLRLQRALHAVPKPSNLDSSLNTRALSTTKCGSGSLIAGTETHAEAGIKPTSHADPVQLPLELFVQVVQHIPPRHIFLLRRVSRTWYRALDSSIFLLGIDINKVRSIHVSKPTGFQDLSTVRCPPHLFSFSGQRLAWMTVKAENDRNKGSGNTIHVHDLEAQTTRPRASNQARLGLTTKYPVRPLSKSKPWKTGNVTALILCDNFVACIMDQTLIMFPGGRRRVLPGDHNGGAVCGYQDTVAILKSWQRDPGPIESNVLWLYTYSTDTWRMIEVPGNDSLHGQWYQGLILDQEGFHILNIALMLMDQHTLLGERGFLMHVRSPGKEWTKRYRTNSYKQNYHSTWLIPRWSGDRYHVRVHMQETAHDLLLDLDDEQLMTYETPTARWYGAFYSWLSDGVDTSRGALWANYLDVGLELCRLPTDFFATEDYLVYVSAGLRQAVMYVFHLRKGGHPLIHTEWKEDNHEGVDIRRILARAASTEYYGPT